MMPPIVEAFPWKPRGEINGDEPLLKAGRCVAGSCHNPCSNTALEVSPSIFVYNFILTWSSVSYIHGRSVYLLYCFLLGGDPGPDFSLGWSGVSCVAESSLEFSGDPPGSTSRVLGFRYEPSCPVSWTIRCCHNRLTITRVNTHRLLATFLSDYMFRLHAVP